MAAVFTAALLVMDVGGLRHLVARVEGGYLAIFLLWVFNAIVFSGAQTAVSVLLMAERSGGGRGGTGAVARILSPVRVGATQPNGP